MKRTIEFSKSSEQAGRLWRRIFTLFGAQLLFLLPAAVAGGATAYYSLTGWFVDGTETQSFLFDIDRGLPRTAPFSLCTWHYNGVPAHPGNAAGDPIAAGGFDPILRLYDNTPALVVWNDDGPTGLDSLINWSTPGMPESLAGGAYQLDLVAYNSTLGGRDGHWAVDLEADAAKFTLTGVDKTDGTGATTISSLSMGSDDVRLPAKLELGTLESLSILGPLFVGNTGAAQILITTGSLATGDSNSYLGFQLGSVGNITLSAGGSWVDSSGYIIAVGWQGDGNLMVQSGSLASFSGPVVLAEYPGSEGNVTVTGHDSILVTSTGLDIGESGQGFLRIENEGKVYSTGLGPLPADTVGAFAFAQGAAEVDGKNSLWSSGRLIVGYFGGQGKVRITNGGMIDTSGDAYIGYINGGDDSSVTLTSTAPDGTRSTWAVSGNLFLAGDELNASNAANSKLTINTGGLVDVAGTTTVWNGGGSLELLGGEMETGSLIVKPGATFTHTDGTLTIAGGAFDPGVPAYAIDGADADDLPIVTLMGGANAVLLDPLGGVGVVVGSSHRGRLDILSGSHVDLPNATSVVNIGDLSGSDGELVVSGPGSQLTVSGVTNVGVAGNGSFRVENGGSVVNATAMNASSIGAFTGSQGLVEVTGVALNGTPSTWDHLALSVGHWGRGTLNISAGGYVRTRSEASIYDTGSAALVTGVGPSGPSRWEIGSALHVGLNIVGSGDAATLTVAAAGQVTADSVQVWQPGTVELNGGVISTSNFELAGGTLRGSGQVTGGGQLSNSGLVSPGLLAPGAAVGTIHVAGDYVQLATGALKMEIGGVALNQFDRLVVDGTATLGGSLRVMLIDPTGGTNPFQPSAGNTFPLVSAGLLELPTFSDIILPDLGPDLRFVILGDLLSSQLLAKVFWNGDYNFDGVVDAADYTVWRDTLGSTTDLRANGDDTGASAGIIDQADYHAWKTHFGQVAGSGAAALRNPIDNHAVPEPGVFLLLGTAITAGAATSLRYMKRRVIS